MGLGKRRVRTSCFCFEGCPRGTYPYDGYFVNAFHPVGPSYGDAHILYRFAGELENRCIWNPVTPALAPGSIEELRKILIVDIDDNPIGFRWDLVLVDVSGGNSWVHDTTPPYSDEIPYPPQDPKSCSRYNWLLQHTVTGPINPAQIFAAFPNACSDDDWPEKAQDRP